MEEKSASERANTDKRLKCLSSHSSLGLILLRWVARWLLLPLSLSCVLLKVVHLLEEDRFPWTDKDQSLVKDVQIAMFFC